MLAIRIRDEAEQDLKEAAQWYERQRSGLGHQFLNQVLIALDAIGANPTSFPVAYRKTRRALIRRFPFAIFYRILPDEILVLAVLHGSRSPGNWKTRIA
ncbi:type II toxin-antitoxin system RelE/ParE family toxin [Parahaliea mediterranea]|uniref:type II toxin-antitoxin system RelE/ParE family toxin n=1 Tax=Parahaliea mediterranea TaxID=651086 RepID=UPI000E2FD507|nr:type II toxin-antitoxin system RelE/ParE family toxin [Parahaliea mediterranea]